MERTQKPKKTRSKLFRTTGRRTRSRSRTQVINLNDLLRFKADEIDELLEQKITDEVKNQKEGEGNVEKMSEDTRKVLTTFVNSLKNEKEAGRQR